MNHIVAQVTKETQNEILHALSKATGNGLRDTPDMQKIRAFIPFKESLIDFMKPLGTEEDFQEYSEEIQEHYDAKLQKLLGDEAFPQAAQDPNAYCRRLIADFYAQYPDSLLGVNEKEHVIESVLYAVKNGLYSKPEYQDIGFTLEWVSILKPILGTDAYARLQAKLSDISETQGE